ncbi:unnamed protein product, partial [Ectocarpus sp. 12 AP-2014]
NGGNSPLLFIYGSPRRNGWLGAERGRASPRQIARDRSRTEADAHASHHQPEIRRRRVSSRSGQEKLVTHTGVAASLPRVHLPTAAIPRERVGYVRLAFLHG